MPDAPNNQAQRYGDLAEQYRRLAESSSPQMRHRYLRMADHYRKLAEAEEPRIRTRLDGN